MEMLEIAIAFVLGSSLSLTAVLLYGKYVRWQMIQAKKIVVADIKKKAQDMEDKRNSVKDRLAKAHEMAKLQQAIQAQMDMPSQNALHSRYKNSLIGEFQDLELKKLSLLKTVLAEGFDPMITVLTATGAREECLLSKYVNTAIDQIGDSLSNPQKHSETTQPLSPLKAVEPKKYGKFILHKGGKDDGAAH
jgi:hypothetical protein